MAGRVSRAFRCPGEQVMYAYHMCSSIEVVHPVQVVVQGCVGYNTWLAFEILRRGFVLRSAA